MFRFFLCVLCASVASFAADYKITARLDPASRTLNGEVAITYTNQGELPLASVRLHLYWNAFRDRNSSFMRGRRQGFDPADAGWIDVTSSDPPGPIRFLAPDDGNSADRTVAELPLPQPLEPGEKITVRLNFNARVPGLIARAGCERDFCMIAQWFPKLGVVQRGLWKANQYHATSEFFADFGSYDVALTVPAASVVAASGDLVSTTGEGAWKTVTYHSDNVHDFAWAAWPGFRRAEERWKNVRLEVFGPADADPRRHFDAAKATLEWLDRNVGPYPYPRLVIVDVPLWAFEAIGMEYPTLVTTSSLGGWTPRAFPLPEVITIHEVGHQYFQGMVANNEAEEAWLDEGLASYVEATVAEQMFGHGSSSLPARLPRRIDLLRYPDLDTIVQPSWTYWSSSSFGSMSYAKPFYLLRTLEQMIGKDKVLAALRLYFERWKFRHPATRDLMDCFNEAAGQNLDWFLRPALYAPSSIDYAVTGMDERRVRVRRLGDLGVPVELTLHLAGGAERRIYWDGAQRWRDFPVESGLAVDWAEITTRALDLNHVDNSYARRPERSAGVKLAALWTFLLQHVMELIACLL